MQEGKIIQSVAKAMRLLDLLAASERPMTLAEISTQTGWPKSTVHGLLSTMREFSTVAQDSDGRYMLGIRLFEYGCTLSNSWTIIEIAKPFIQHISYETGEAVFLSILDRGEVITLDRADNRTGLNTAAEVGCRLPIHCTSQGKLFLAYMPEQERKAVLSRTVLAPYTPLTITTPEQLQRELVEIRAQGYAIENGEYKTGLRSVSAPIFDQNGAVPYAIGIIGMFRQIESEQFTRATQIVVETAKKISKFL
ncbi:MAG TPA: IclR family transcriptional regulator [Candidatus Avoscillospira avicola]|uniref:Glycerol operon regulatory protein n=1 Tax=Candidatus Avoscillospira avicola TaxID=2840706 RepID=A0A9D1DI23_9FIRM|nr:IclR family transcriptional regulator [Candidatus Avoscillospira avicola]